MDFDGALLRFFPTPYPDEIFYSVLCRHHIRSGTPAFVSTAKEIWGKKISANLYLPQSLGVVASRIPQETGLTAECFTENHTVYPYVKSFLPQERGLQVLDLLQSQSQHTLMAHQVCGLSRSKNPQWQYLRYCEDCWNDDIHQYGEPYWHRLHLISGVLMCPVHAKPTLNSIMFLKEVQNRFHAASFSAATIEPVPKFSDSLAEKLLAVASDVHWVLRNGNALAFSEAMYEIFDQLLRTKGYRSFSGLRSKNLLLDNAICEFYGQELLDVLRVYPQGVTPWSARALQQQDHFLYPVYYLLLMRFLAGSAEAFFMQQHETVQHPYGEGPWPCRNPICPHYLHDVIVDLPMVSYCARHCATFACPHCGFTYRRRQALPKSEQYAGQIDIVDRGPLWMDAFRKMMEEGAPYYRIAETLQCYFNTIKRLAVEQGFLPEDKMPAKRNYNYPRGATKEVAPKSAEPPNYRQVLLQAMQNNPGCSRSFLIKLCPEAYCWLRANDVEWYEENAPASRTNTPADWPERDEEALQNTMKAVRYLCDLPGRPVWINRRSVEKYGGLNNLYRNLRDSKLPKTQAYLEEALESEEDWRKKKIQWAINELHEAGKPLHLPQIQIKASIAHTYFVPLEDFARECIDNLL